MMKPSRRASNGQDIPTLDSADIVLNEPKPKSVSVASAPPVTTASASPYWIMRAARPIACPLEAQADATANACPWMPCRIDTAAAAALGMYIGIPSGEIRIGPFSRITSRFVCTVVKPPIPVAMISPMRIGSYGWPSDQPASAIASSAATTANCAKRSSRRASLTERCSAGSKLSQ